MNYNLNVTRNITPPKGGCCYVMRKRNMLQNCYAKLKRAKNVTLLWTLLRRCEKKCYAVAENKGVTLCFNRFLALLFNDKTIRGCFECEYMC